MFLGIKNLYVAKEQRKKMGILGGKTTKGHSGKSFKQTHLRYSNYLLTFTYFKTC